METATVGGGCFWCIEALFEALEGVVEVTSGYAGGHTANPSYQQVSNGSTGHAEVVQVRYDQQVITYADLLRVFFAMHNPTHYGARTKYRSVIFYHNKAQQQTATQIIQEVQPFFDSPIVTELLPFTQFYKAEERHQHYYSSNPEKAYCQTIINPKLQKLREQFGGMLRRKGRT